MSEKKIVLIDDHKVVRNGLRMLIEKLGPYKVILEFDNGAELIKDLILIKGADLLVMDIAMPELDGEATVERLNELGIEVPVLVLTLTHDDDRVVKLFRMGVRGYLMKDSPADALRNALKAVFDTGYYHNEFLTYSLLHEQKATPKSKAEIILEQLSQREREFLKLVCHEAEYTYDQIAGEMGVQHRTVDGYRESIFEKFEIKSKTGLVLFVLKYQLIELL